MPTLNAYQNAKSTYIAATISQSLHKTLTHHLDPLTDIDIILESGGVWMHKKRVFDGDLLVSKDDIIKVYTCPNQGLRFSILPEYIHVENDDILVINKPAGITSVPDRSNLYYNLSAAVETYYRDKKIDYTPQPISRLDFMVSGLIIFPKSKAIEKTLFKLSMKRRIQKKYTAILENKKALPKCLRIKDKIGFINKATQDSEGKDTHSLFMFNKQNDQGLVYSVIIFTGRRHQIRYHASHYLSPLIGDAYYGAKEQATPEISLRATGYNFNLKGKKYRLRLATDAQPLALICPAAYVP